jgi:hypothetical protein
MKAVANHAKKKIKLDLIETGVEFVDEFICLRIELTVDSCEHHAESLGYMKRKEFLD